MIEYTFSNTSLRNTRIYAPNGSIAYTITSESHFFRADNTTVSRVIDGQSIEIVKFEWHDTTKRDVMKTSGNGGTTVKVKDYLPKKGMFSSSRLFSTPNGQWKWKSKGPIVYDPHGSALARYQKNKRLFGSNKSATGAPASLIISSPDASQRLDDIVFGLLIMHKDKQRQDKEASEVPVG
ncbi:uncharacterized protein EI90DRAFT_3120608 [Cantharellus anzutake]|uniref:uncharacterized protein n=1 Tax=Cantharellus anzutake TaxID=1750568 RepID=UPI0019085CA9|nr:uncharacterized protein EI90DRAFT_3120608 [Cantharellus anzutake]KAF8335493.1 hypothetical protein EI90DRAFT_3120608 [Cantharellus anzutake]